MRLRTSVLIVALLGLVAAMASATAFAPPTDVAADGRRAAIGTTAPARPAAGPDDAAEPSPTPAPTTAARRAPPPDRTAVRGRLAALLSSPLLAVDEATVAVAVRDAYGRVVFDHAADQRLLPASTMKLVTAASALSTFGPDHRFETVAGVTAPVGPDGTVAGNLILVGSGDPVLGTPLYERWIYPARPRTRLEDLADAIVAAGVRRIAGSVLGDGTAFSAETAASGWPERYFTDLDARHISGLTVNGGVAYAVDPTPAPPHVDTELVDDPALLAARELTDLLVARGVTVDGPPRSGSGSAGVVRILAAVDSPPLRDVLQHMVRRSDNQVADTLLRSVAVARTGTGSWTMGGLAARAAIASLGVDTTGLVIRDGSGLSRGNRLSAGFLADLDVAMAAGHHRDDWWSLMAVAGREGTLRHRLVGTLGEGRFLGKTGTLDDVKAVAGTVRGPGEQRYHLAVLANGADGAEQTVVSVLMDELVLALAEGLHDCTRRPLPAPSPTATAAATPAPRPSPPHVAPYTLVCATTP